MCLKKKKTEKDNALCVISTGIGITIIILLSVSWIYRNYTFDGVNINAEITSSYGTIISAFLTTLWSGIAVWVYYSALKVQSKELKISQEVAFAQNLSFLISCSSDIISKLRIRGILKYDYEGHNACNFLFIGLRYCYEIMKDESIVPIVNLEETKRRLEEDETNNPDRELDEMIASREMELLAYSDPKKFFEEIKESNFNQYKLDFQHLFMLSNVDLEWKNKKNQEYCHIQDAFNKVWDKYGHLVIPYFKSIENSIFYLAEYVNSIEDKKKYVSWITSNIPQTGLAFFYYYLYCRKDKEQNLIVCCQTLDFFKDLNQEQFLLNKNHRL